MNLLLLRGLTREKSHWGSFLSKLKRSIPEANVYCLDLPGAGTENDKESPISVDRIVDLLRAQWLEDLVSKNEEPWHIVGHSLGGMVAMNWSYRFPKDFKKTFLINTSSRGYVRFWKRVRPIAIKEFVKIARSEPGKQREKLVLELTSTKHRENNKLLQSWEEFAKLRPIKTGTAIRQLIAASRFRAQKHPDSNLVFLCSQGDGLVNPESSQVLAQVFESPCLIHPEAGHDLTLDDPDWVIECICENLK